MNTNELQTGQPYYFTVKRKESEEDGATKKKVICRVFMELVDNEGNPCVLVRGQYPRQGFGSQQADMTAPVYGLIPTTSILCIERA